METAICKNCQFYIQHYALGENGFFRVNCGHCTCERVKRKRPDTKGCDHFLPGAADADSFVTKEYLSKRLLDYVLSLDLLPEIMGDAGNLGANHEK